MRLQGKTALITAAGQGIGKATALAFAKEGAQVWATDVNPKLLESYAGVANVTTAVLDVLDKAAIQKFTADLPALNVLFNCAGFVANGALLDATDADWEFSFNLNARAQFWMIQATLPKMIANGGGSIINMASVCSSIKGLPNRFIYGASKAAVVGLTKSVAADYVGQGIRCNAIAPARWTRRLWATASTALPTRSKHARTSLPASPWGAWRRRTRLHLPIVFLASDESVFATGQNFWWTEASPYEPA
jgi:2-keto-3-deoxy-L-fuconate dehydrogenase